MLALWAWRAKDISGLRLTSVNGPVCDLPRHVPQAGYPRCRGRMRAEQLLHRETGQRFDDEHAGRARREQQQRRLRVRDVLVALDTPIAADDVFLELESNWGDQPVSRSSPTVTKRSAFDRLII